MTSHSVVFKATITIKPHLFSTAKVLKNLIMDLPVKFIYLKCFSNEQFWWQIWNTLECHQALNNSTIYGFTRISI